jgi:hypothetical protein
MVFLGYFIHTKERGKVKKKITTNNTENNKNRVDYNHKPKKSKDNKIKAKLTS